MVNDEHCVYTLFFTTSPFVYHPKYDYYMGGLVQMKIVAYNDNDNDNNPIYLEFVDGRNGISSLNIDYTS